MKPVPQSLGALSTGSRRVVMLLRILAVAALAYYLVMVIQVGFSVSFYLFWPALSAVLAGSAEFVGRKVPVATGPSWLGVAILGLLTVIGVAFIVIQALILGASFREPKPDLPVVIVLGAQVDENGPMAILQSRLETALDYAVENQETLFVVTGGRGKNEPVAEAHAMRDYLVEHGLAEHRILVEDQSTNTHENMMFALELLPQGATTVGIVSSNYHMFRATLLARAAGIPDPQPVPAPSSGLLYVHNAVREFFALVKDAATGNLSS